MAGDVKISYGSTGFEKVNHELATLEKTGSGAGGWFTPLKKTLAEAETAGVSFTSKLSSGLQSVASVAGGVVIGLAKVAAAIAAISVAAAGAATVAFTSWSIGVLKTTESFRMLEISLYGALKSWEAVNKVSEFAKKYSAEYPAMYKDVMQTMQSMAYMPSMKPMVMAGDVKLMKEAMNIVQALATMRPEQGVQGATFALREALSGNWRSLQMRFDVPVESIARSAGMTMEQMKSKPEAGFQALGAFTKEFVGVDTMALMAKNLGTQVDNLREKYSLWKESIGKAGFYDKVIDYLLKLNEAFENLLKSGTLDRITKQISSFMESVVDKIAGIFTKGIDWEKIGTLGDLGEALKQIARNAIEEFKKVWEVAKGPLAEVMKDIFIFVGKAAGEAFKEALVPAIKQQLNEVGDTLKTWDEWLREKMGAPTRLKAPEIPEWKGPRPWRQKAEELAVTPPQPGWIQEWVGQYRPERLTPGQMGAEEKFAQYGAWSKMAGTLATAGEEPERKTAWSRYLGGEIDWTTMKKQEKVETFRGEQAKRLEEIVGMPEAGAELRGKAYSELFNVAMTRGEYGKAETYMNKSLDEMVKAMKEEAGLAQKDSGNLDTIAKNTSEMVTIQKSREEQEKQEKSKPGGKEPFDPYRGHNVRSGSMVFSDQPIGDVVAREVAQDLVE